MIATLALLLAAASTPTDPGVTAIETALQPASVIAGEPPQTKPLAATMAALGVTAVGIAVIHDGNIAWARSYGTLTKGGVPAGPDTLFQAASISKAVASVGIMHLVEAGKLDLDRPVNAYLTSWNLPDSPLTATAPVTLRRLLSHTAGTNVHGFAGYAAGLPVPTVVEVLNGEKPANSDAIKVETVPGTAWSYSGGGFTIAQQAIVDTLKSPFPGLMAVNVLIPAGMTHSGYIQPATPAILAAAAMPHDGKGMAIAGGPHSYPELAAAGLWTTPSDLARLAIAIQASLAGKPGAVLSVGAAHEMLAPGIGDWGLGWHVGGGKDRRWFSHTGGNEGYRCILFSYDNGDGIVVMTNGDNGGPLYDAIVRTYAVSHGWPDLQPKRRTIVALPAASLDRFIGSYRLTVGPIVAIQRDGDHLVADLPGLGPRPLLADGPASFFLRDEDISMAFAADASGAVTGMTANASGSVIAATRLP